MARILVKGQRISDDELDALVEAIEEKDSKPLPRRMREESGLFKRQTTRVDRTRLVDLLEDKEHENS